MGKLRSAFKIKIKGMFDDHLYNLLNQLVEEHKSLWRIKGKYKSDADQCQDCTDILERIEKRKEENIEDMKEMAKKHLEEQ